MHDTINGVLIGLLPGFFGALVIWLRSLAKRNDAESLYLRSLIAGNTQRLDNLENGGGTAKVKQVLSEVGAITQTGVFGRRSSPVNAESVPPAVVPLVQQALQKDGNAE